MRIESSILRLSLGAACLLLLACGSSDPTPGEQDPKPDGGSVQTPDGGSQQTPDAGPPTPSISVSFLEPSAATVYTTNGSVLFRAQVSGGAARDVELLQGTEVLATLTPPYEYTWNTASLAEGSYALTVRATAEDGSGTAVSPARTVVVDRTPAAVLSQTPTAGESNVYIEDPVTLTFSEPLLASTLNTNSVKLSDGSFSGYGLTLSLSADGKTLTVLPRTVFSAPEQFTVILRPEVTDLAGNPIDDLFYASEPWNFPVWHAPPALSHGTSSSSGRNHALAAPRRGPPTMTWTQEGRLCAARWDGRAWQALGPTTSSPCGTVAEDYGTAPSIALDSAERPVISWRGSGEVAVARWDGSAWRRVGSNGGLRVNALGTAARPAMALDAAGNPVVAWDDSNTSTIDMYVARWDGSAWQPLGAALSATAGQFTWTSEPSLAVDGQGRPVLAWQELGSSTGQRIHVRRWSGTAWEALGGPLSVAGGSVDARTPSLKVDSQNRPVVAWSESLSGGGTTVHVRRWQGSSWVAVGGTLNAAATGATPSATRPSLALDGKDAPVVAWEEADSSGVRHVHVRRWDDVNTTWKGVGDPVGAVSSSSDALFPSLVADEVGRPSVAFSEGASVLVRRSNQL